MTTSGVLYLFNVIQRREVKENGNGEYAERHIHAWGGERSGALGALALRRGAQLAGYLAAPAVLHREAAGRESPRLLSYFRDGIRWALAYLLIVRGSLRFRRCGMSRSWRASWPPKLT